MEEIQEAQHELKTKSTHTQHTAKITNCCVIVIVANITVNKSRVNCKARIPPKVSMIGPKSNLPKAIENVEKPNNLANCC
mmetsp:Transcript_31048/g.35648  ORF Transcript_31048/g.35648 Transcript_31048/m.35648 type:complete len:80 (-) Transcript_31048:103-342(-)